MANTEDLGISFVHNQVAKMGFFFREQPKHDFGIDAHIELANEEGIGSGRNIGVQIKSGSSYFKLNQEGDIVHYTDERHIRYWAEHSLPVILIIYDPEQEIGWWCDVKSYISRHPSLLSGGPYKIVLSTSQQFSHQTKEVLMDTAIVAQSPLALERQYFSIISVDDISTNQAKRYRSEVLVGSNNNDVIRLAIYQATEHLKMIVEHSSDRRAKYWGDQKPHLITLFVYRDLDDKAHTNWVARTIWRDPHNSGAQLVNFGKKNDFTEDIDIDFADNQKHQGWREFISGRIITKYQFLKKVERWIARSDELVEEARKLMVQRDEEQIAEYAFENSMSKLAKSYTDEVESNYDDGTTGPAEVRDAEIRYAGTIGSGGNVFIAFTDRGLETWKDPKKRSYMVRSYLQRYSEDREMLGFELKKLKS